MKFEGKSINLSITLHTTLMPDTDGVGTEAMVYTGIFFMLDLVTNAVSALQAETASYPHAVQIWMKVMGASFLASLMFVLSKTGARWIFAALILNILGLVIGKIANPDASRAIIGTYVHLLFWPAILWAVWGSARQLSFSLQQNRTFDWIYIFWLGWASLLMSISLIFDIRTLGSIWLD